MRGALHDPLRAPRSRFCFVAMLGHVSFSISGWQLVACGTREIELHAVNDHRSPPGLLECHLRYEAISYHTRGLCLISIPTRRRQPHQRQSQPHASRCTRSVATSAANKLSCANHPNTPPMFMVEP